GGRAVKRFAALYAELDGTTRTGEKVAAMERYFRAAAPEDAAWAVYFLSGRKPPQAVPSRRLAAWAMELAGIEPLIFDECYQAVGDLAETVALLLPPPTASDDRALSLWVREVLLPLRKVDEAEQKRAMLAAWACLSPRERFLWNKLITGELRVGVSQNLLTRALASVAGIDAALVAHRLMGDWLPTADFYTALISPEAVSDTQGRPYPFFLASQLDDGPESLGDIHEWQAEWKWD